MVRRLTGPREIGEWIPKIREASRELQSEEILKVGGRLINNKMHNNQSSNIGPKISEHQLKLEDHPEILYIDRVEHLKETIEDCLGFLRSMSERTVLSSL